MAAQLLWTLYNYFEDTLGAAEDPTTMDEDMLQS
jgi:hypothetical protein